MNKIAIITGDIINSQKYETSIWLDKLKDVLSDTGKKDENWEIYRGDSFQLIAETENALHTALLIKSYIKSNDLDVRMAIGIGEIEFKSKKITESNGSAFVHSGRKFELLKKETLGIQSGNEGFDEIFSVILGMMDLIISNWKPSTSKVVYAALKNPGLNQSDLAKILKKKSQGTISSALKRAGFDEIQNGLELYKNKIREL